MKTKKCTLCKRILQDSFFYKRTKSKDGLFYCCKECERERKKLPPKGGIGFGDKNPNWKGDKIKIKGLHDWVRQKFIKTDLCQNCKKVPPLDLANISPKYNKETYTRDPKNWRWLCRKCHINSDGRTNRGELHPHHKLTKKDVLEIRERYAKFPTKIKYIAEEYGVSFTTISSAIRRKTWKSV